MTTVSVTGGADGVTAQVEELLGMAAQLRRGAAALGDALDELHAPMLRWQLADGTTDDLIGALELHDAWSALAGPFGPVALAGDRLDHLAAGLEFAASAYQHAEDHVRESLLSGLGHLFAGRLLAGIGDFRGAEHELFADLPALTDLSTAFTGWLETPFAAAVTDGRAVLHDLGADERPQSTQAPTTLADLITGLALRNAGRHGEVSVSFVVGADGARRAIVDVPGTKSWNPAPNRDITSVGTDIRALAGLGTAYEDGIFAALTAAGVTPDEDVMLVGHSEGGIVAVNAARDAATSGRFRITHVVTAGSPIGRVARALPSNVQVLALENRADVVPHCDAADNPDRSNITTVTVDEQHFSITANHGLEQSYEPIARAADESGDASIRAFTNSARGFLGRPTMHTHAYRITRDP
jgi:hypothetical protein